MRRVGPKGAAEFEPISWDDAIEEIAHRFTRVIAQWGPEAILPFSYAGTLGRIQYYAGHPFFHALGASQLDRTICVSTAYAGWQATRRHGRRERRRADGGRRPGAPLGDQRRLHAHQPDDAGQGRAGARGAHRLHRPLPDPHGQAGGRAPHDPLRDGRGPGARPDARPGRARTSWTTAYIARATLGFEALREHVRAYPPERVAAITGAARRADRRPGTALWTDAGRVHPRGHRALAARERRHDLPDHRLPARANRRLRPPARRRAARQLGRLRPGGRGPRAARSPARRRRRARST